MQAQAAPAPSAATAQGATTNAAAAAAGPPPGGDAAAALFAVLLGQMGVTLPGITPATASPDAADPTTADQKDGTADPKAEDTGLAVTASTPTPTETPAPTVATPAPAAAAAPTAPAPTAPAAGAPADRAEDATTTTTATTTTNTTPTTAVLPGLATTAPGRGVAAPGVVGEAETAATTAPTRIADPAAAFGLDTSTGGTAPADQTAGDGTQVDLTATAATVVAAGGTVSQLPPARKGGKGTVESGGEERRATASAAVTTTTTAEHGTTPGLAITAPAASGRSDHGDERAADSGQTSAFQVQGTPRRETAGTDATAPAATGPAIDRERLEKLADGLAARLKLSHAGDGARVRMHLEPRELGEVVVRLAIRDGIAQASLITENRDASRMLTSTLADLRTALAERGVHLDRVDVRVAGEHGRDARQHQAHDPRHGERRRAGSAPLTFGRIDGHGPPAEPTAPVAGLRRSAISVLA